MSWELILSIIAVTGLRVGWIVSRPVPHDVEQAIMPGIRRIRPVLSRRVRVEGNAPYGILWYGMNYPLGRIVGFRGREWMILLALGDSIFLWFSQTMSLLGCLAYLAIGTFQLFRAPWNVTINWIIIGGVYSWWLLILAPLAKLPVGLPLHAFGDTGRGILYQHNYVYYGLLGTMWLIVLLNSLAPTIRDLSVIGLGAGWTLLLGHLFRARIRRS